MWLGVIHGGNFVQSVTGFEVPPRLVLRHFDVHAPVAGDGLRLAGRALASSARYGVRVVTRRGKPKRSGEWSRFIGQDDDGPPRADS